MYQEVTGSEACARCTKTAIKAGSRGCRFYVASVAVFLRRRYACFCHPRGLLNGRGALRVMTHSMHSTMKSASLSLTVIHPEVPHLQQPSSATKACLRRHSGPAIYIRHVVAHRPRQTYCMITRLFPRPLSLPAVAVSFIKAFYRGLIHGTRTECAHGCYI